MRLNRKNGLIVGILAFACCALCGGNVFADGDGWVGTGGTPGGQSGGGGSSCLANVYDTNGTILQYGYDNYRYRIDCAKVSWIYYEAQPGGGNYPVTIAPDSRLGGGETAQIPEVCYHDGQGGFWHYGVNRQSTKNGIIECSWSGCVPNYSAMPHKWGHWMTVTVGDGYGEAMPGQEGYDNRFNLSPDNPFGWHVNELGHTMYSSVDSGTRYTATRAALSGDSELLDDYKNALLYFDDNRSENEIMNLTRIDNGVWGFCAWEGMNKEYYASSNISNGINWKGTGRVKENATVNLNPDRLVTIPDGATNITVAGALRFSHNIYASFEDTSSSNWRVERSGNGFSDSSVSMSRTNTPAAQYSGSTTITSKITSSLYQATTRPFGDGENYYISRDVFDVTFSKEGTYEFCESLYLSNSAVSNKRLTTVCTTYKVSKESSPPPPPPSVEICDRWTPASYTSSYLDSDNNGQGTTSVVSKVRNNTLGGDYVNSVYAKPTDNINWAHCYYPGIQKIASALATSVHGSHSEMLPDGSKTTNINTIMSQLYAWGNYFSVTSSVSKGSNFRNPNSTSTGNYRVGTLTPTIYNGGRYAIGSSGVKSLLDNTYRVEYGSGKNKAGATLTETNKSSRPTSAVVWNEHIHVWSCNYEESCEKCGSYSCNCVSCNCEEVCTGEGEDQSCTIVCDTCCDICCYSCAWGRCEHSNNYYGSFCHENVASDHADVLVPYNFINTATISLNSSYVYAGEIATIGSSAVQIRTKSNNVTRGTYATQVDDAKVKFVAYLSSSNSGSAKEGVGSGKAYNICNALSGYEACNELDSRDGATLNSSGVLGLGTSPSTQVASNSLTSLMGSSYNVYDGRAGKYYCVVAAVYPYTSGTDTNMDASGSNNWYVSAPSCAVIAKKPSLEVWGNGLYTAGKVFTASAEKRVIDGFVGFTPRSSSNTTVFGSWVETNIIANGQVAGLASGAATGFPGYTIRTLTNGVQRLSGSREGSTRRFCTYRSPLTMPNAGCLTTIGGLPGVNVGSLGSPAAGMNKPVDRDALIARFMTEDGTFKYRNTYTRLSQLVSELGSTIIPAGQNQTYVIDASGKTFTIDSNIQYAELYNNFTDIPKLIIRADNININCNVNRIDAVLIADKIQNNTVAGNVNTCSNAGGVDDSARSNQLKINGAVITGSLTANRTYGAGVGAYSVIPAEIVDYDSSLYIWGSQRAEASASGKLDVIYLRELSPRL